MPTRDRDTIDTSRRGALKFAGATRGNGTCRRPRSRPVPEEANSDALNIVRKGIDKKLDIVNIDLLEEQTSKVYGHGTYVFVVNGSGKQCTLAESQRAWGIRADGQHRARGIAKHF